ncbi:MAG: two-component regulator propeller domain-containing protein [Bryobacteraceae bacterium]|jgi:ligand-binding sensor domain-containing protein/signal transduction histidine kinase
MILRLACAFWLCFAPGRSATLPQRGLQGYSRRIWQTQDGLPEEPVQALAQTPDGYLWIGTSGGLVRFDGAEMVVFNRENTPALRSNSIFCLLVSRAGDLWIGTEGGGVVRYHRGEFRRFSGEEGLSNGFVRSILEDRRGQFWVGTDDGLFRLHGDRLARVDGLGGVPAVAVHDIREDSHGRLWVGGSSLLMLDDGRTVEYRLEGGSSEHRVKSILETRDGVIWVGTVSGLEQLRPEETGRFVHVPEISGTVRVLREDHDGALWIGTIGEGIFLYRAGRFTRLRAPDYLPSDTVLSLLEDHEGNLWVGTQTGLLRLSATPVSTFPLPGAAGSDFSTIYQDVDKSLWIASTQLYRYAGQTARPYRFGGPLDEIRIRNLFRDRAGTLWAGTDGHGLWRIEGSRSVQYTKRDGLINDFVRAIYQGRDGSLWIGTDEGVSRWRQGRFTNYGVAQGLCYFSIRSLAEDRNGDLWIGTDHGVSRLHNDKFVHDAVVESLREERVWAIHEDPSGGLWLGTLGAGLFRWKAGVLTAYTSAQGLANNSIYHILEDPAGMFWMSGPNGVSSVLRRDLERVAESPGTRPAVTLYGISDGLETTQMHGGTQPAGCLAANGEIWFPSNKGPVRITPGYGAFGNPPAAVIERIVADGRSLPTSGKLELPPGGGKLEIQYSAIRLRSQERIRFRYKLEGFDNEWTEAFGRRLAFYTNLPAGPYRFRVAAYEMNAPASVSEAAVEMYWKPHFYATPWFLTLCVAAAAAAALGIHRFRLRQIHARFEGILEERNRVARELHDTIIQGCGGVSALLEASATVGDADPAMKQGLLEGARTQIRSTIDEARRVVWDLRQSPDAGGELTATVSKLAEQLSQESHIPIEFGTDGKPRALEHAIEHDLVMVAREALSNAVRHAAPTSVRLRLSFGARELRMQVEDDGRGFDPSSPANGHYGIIGMRERIEHLGGKFILRSGPGTGTHLSVAVPLTRTASGGTA